VTLALRAFRRFLQHWSVHPRAAEARRTVADLESALPRLFAELDVPADQAFDVALQNETIQSLLAQSRYRDARQAAETLLRKYPHIEGLSYLGDHQGVLEVFRQAGQTAGDETSPFNAMLYHLVAMAACVWDGRPRRYNKGREGDFLFHDYVLHRI
jgi:hypothetical protein